MATRMVSVSSRDRASAPAAKNMLGPRYDGNETDSDAALIYLLV